MMPANDPHDDMVAGLAPAYVPGVLSALVAAEIFASASPEQAHAFYVAVGRRLAALAPVEHVNGIGDLCDAANRLWAAMGWGRVEMDTQGEGIVLRHRRLPPTMPENEEHWGEMIAALLQGAYDAWFRVLGSPEQLVTRVISQTESAIEFRHGL
ncbi:MAG TPA: hypothetical protein VN222_02705 [Novosphingobium sp.]|nr:hypothetical protein [Novosphingobium sp.]